MMDWISSHVSVLQLGVSVITAAIWVVYLQMLVMSVRRQRRTVLTINRGAGDGFAARIIVSNLSYEPVYLRDMILVLHTDKERVVRNVTDLKELGQDDMSKELEGTVQGPLGMGDHIDVGSFNGALSRVDDRVRPAQGTITRIEVVIVAARERVTGVRRRYDVVRGDRGMLALEPVDYRVETLSQRACHKVLREI